MPVGLEEDPSPERLTVGRDPSTFSVLPRPGERVRDKLNPQAQHTCVVPPSLRDGRGGGASTKQAIYWSRQPPHRQAQRIPGNPGVPHANRPSQGRRSFEVGPS